MKSQNTQQTPTEALIPFDRFLLENQICRVTGWRYRKAGWISAINISGRWYVRRTEIQRFIERAESGEFSKAVTPPKGSGAK